MTRLLVVITMALAVASSLGWRAQDDLAPPPTITFVAYDVIVDTGAHTLGAYQIEISATNPATQLVGVEGGEHPAFATPPYYDPAALHDTTHPERIILADLSTNAELPTGETRVARLHLSTTHAEAVSFKVNTLAAGDADANPIDLRVRLIRASE